MNPRCFVRIAGAGLIALIVYGCETLPEGPFPRATEVGWWHGEDASGPAKIVVHIGEQKAYFYKGKSLVGEATVSRENLGFLPRPAITLWFQRTWAMSRRYLVIMWMITATSSDQTLIPEKIASRPAHILTAPECRMRCFSAAATRCIRVTFRRLPRRTVAFVCQGRWR